MRRRDRWVALGQLLLLLLVALASMATSGVSYPCTPGGWPPTGTSAVGVDVGLTFIGPDLDLRGPAIGGSLITLYRVEGSKQIEVPVSVHRARSWPTANGTRREVEWRVEPEAPLEPDHFYRLRGFDMAALRSAHVSGSSGLFDTPQRWTVVDRRFYTGSNPRLLAALQTGWSDTLARISLIFSEPMQVDSLIDRIVLTADDGTRLVVGVPQPAGGIARQVRIVAGVADGRRASGGRIGFEPGVQAASGVELRGFWPEGGEALTPLDGGTMGVRAIDDFDRLRRPEGYLSVLSTCVDDEPEYE